MHRFTLASSLAAVLTAASTAQVQPAASQAHRMPQPARDAGTYHVATGTWTRATSSVAAFGLSDTIYSNTANSGYYAPSIGPMGAGFAGGEAVDDGAIPGTTNPTVFSFGGATTDIYRVAELQFAYCDFETTAGVSGWTLNFFEDYAPCTYPTQAPVGTVVLSGLPTNGCWFLTVDLSSATGTGQEFSLQADGGAAAPGYDGDPALDSFGVKFKYTGSGLANAGMIIAGDPANTDTGWTSGIPSTGSNTYFGELGGCPGTGTGFGNDDLVWRESVTHPAQTGCWFFGGYANASAACGGTPGVPMAGYWLELSGASGPVDCICTAGCTGAVTSTGAPAICEIFGNPIASANDVQLRASGVPPNQFGIFATGRAPIPAMTVNSGNGWLCIDPGAMGGLGRFQGASQIKNSGPTGTFSLDTSIGEWSLTSIPTSTGTYAAMSGVTSYFQAWFREPVGAGFNFSGSTIVTWQ